jgi:hypothetical protein
MKIFTRPASMTEKAGDRTILDWGLAAPTVSATLLRLAIPSTEGVTAPAFASDRTCRERHHLRHT